MSELSKQKALIEAVASAFASNKEASELHVTPDGNCFLEKNKNAAEHHARTTQQPLVIVTRAHFEAENMDDIKHALAEKKAREQDAIEKEAAEKEAARLEAEEKAEAEKELAEKQAAEKAEAEAIEVEEKEAAAKAAKAKKK